MKWFLPLFVAASLPAEDLHWFKGNTHTHSLWSDGNDFPEMIAAWYKDQGYDFLALSDHNTLQAGEKWMTEEAIEKRRITLGRKVLDKCRDRYGDAWLETRTNAGGKVEVRLKTLADFRGKLEEPGKFLLVQAEEVTASFAKAPIHINAINPQQVIEPLKDVVSIRETMRRNLQAIAAESVRSGRPMIAHINHPNFRWALTAEDLAHVIEDRYFEVYNGHPTCYNEGAEGRADTHLGRVWDIANTIRLAELKQPPLFGMATDDSHHYHGGANTPGRGWVMVRAAQLDADELVRALQRGDFYASTGVLLDEVAFDKAGRRLSLKIQGRPGVKYITEFRGTRRGYDRAVKEVPTPEGDNHPVRFQHSEQVGEVLATSTSLEPAYTLTGDELYVRAVIRSDEVMTNPITPGEKQQAWTQPVGWEAK
jgi:hypothetical protein